MTRFDDRIRDGLHEAAGGRAAAPDLDRVAADVRRRRARRDVVRKVELGGLAVIVLVATGIGFGVLQGAFRGGDRVGTPAPTPTPTAVPSGAFGLGFEVCRDTSSEVVTPSGTGTAWVYTEAPNGDCPKRGEGSTGVAADVDGDGLADTSPVPIPDCSFLCEAFAAPDLDGDGFSEVAVSNGGADGYGVSLFDLTDAPALERIILTNTVSQDPGDGPFAFPWTGAAAHQESAYCDERDGTTVLVLEATSVNEFDADVTVTTVAVSGATANVLGEDTHTISFEELEATGGMRTRLCGSRVLDPDPEPEPQAPIGEDIGAATPLCYLQRETGLDLINDGVPDLAWVGVAVRADGSCPEEGSDTGTWVVAVDLTGDGIADASTETLDVCAYVGCFPWDTTDLDADGDGELVVLAVGAIVDHLYFSVSEGEVGYSIEPIVVAEPGAHAAGVDPNVPLLTASGGDAGFSAWMRCEGYPEAPLLIYTWVSTIIDSEEPAEWHEVTLRLESDGLVHVVDVRGASLPPGNDPGWPRPDGSQCGLDFESTLG